MIELTGKYNSAKVFTDVIDSASISQIIELCSQEFTVGQRIRMMPDVHAGAGCVIGTTMTVSDKIVPNLVGYDIGCGMETVLIKERSIELMQLDKLIGNKIPSGFSIRTTPHKYAENIDLAALRCADNIDLRRAECSLGTLGGGNHFIEADRGESGIYIVIHSGSRHLGVEVAKYYQEAGYKQLNRADDEAVRQLIDSLKAQGREKDIRRELKKLENTKRTEVPKSLAYVNGSLFDDYIHDMKLVQRYADLNRRAMMDEIIRGMKLTPAERFTTVHNYIDTDNMILRKGAVSAGKGEKLIIPINMRDGSLICTGKGNPDWNCSAPHGAGRLMSRGEAKASFTVSEFKKQMSGIYSTTVGRGTLDECPMAYKSIDDIVGNLGDTADITEIIKPIYNFKAGAEE
ncbi:MAG: RtcB family protein [Oscillospiraceae bacterium]